jgi:hypothetical protein
MNSLWAKITLLSLLLAFSVSVDAQTFYGTTDVKKFREGRNKEFRSKEESPLTEKDFPNFKGLNYFSVNEKYRLTAEFVRTSDAKYFQMPTSSGRSQKYIKFGVLKFKLNNQDYSLNVYQSDAETLAKFPEYKDLLFVPFKDTTNGKSTYGGGRYINLTAPLDKQIILDFNLAYNPSCAYGSDRYSCPLPPKENFLQVEINAGEKSYLYSNAK